MKYLIMVSAILVIVSCGKSNDTQQSTTNINQAFDLSSAKGLCLYVINKAEKETGEMKPPSVVTYAYKTITCLEVTSEHIPLWQCMKDQTDLGNGFYKADEYCADNF